MATKGSSALPSPGEPVDNWKVPPFPPHNAPLDGKYVTVAPIRRDAAAAAQADLEQFFDATRPDAATLHHFLSYGPFPSVTALRDWFMAITEVHGATAQFYALRVGGKTLGVATYLRIDPACGSIEIGHIVLSRALQQTRAATEAFYLMMWHAFELGYRRVEWKTNVHNRASIRAAKRLGFSSEGVFRQHRVDKGRNRDTLWFAIIDRDWPRAKVLLEAWLAESNFDTATGRQKTSLADTTKVLHVPLAHL
jgi:RimJ/RimL family protein N-acetyltransferase